MLTNSIILTNKCTLSCPDCPLDSFKSNPKLKFNDRVFVFNIYGGDPLSSNRLKKIITDYKNKHIINIFTPLHFLPEKTDYLKGTNLFVIYIGTDLEYSNDVCGKKTYGDVKKNILELINKGIKPIIYHPVNKATISDIPELNDFLEENSLHCVYGLCNSENYGSTDISSVNYYAKKEPATLLRYNYPSHYCQFLFNKLNLYEQIKLYNFSQKNLDFSYPDNSIYLSKLIKNII